MQNNRTKWEKDLNIKDCADIMIEWCIKARERNSLRKSIPEIYYSYIVDNNIPLNYLKPISNVFKYSQKDIPYVENSRDILLKSLSVALKTHFLNFQYVNVEHEPYFFVIPDLSSINDTKYGLIYKLNNNKTIIVSEKNIEIIFENSKVVNKNAFIVNNDSFKWFSLKNLNKIKQINENFDIKNTIKFAQEAKDFNQLEKFGTVIKIPYDLKEKIKPLGVEWSKNLKTWYIPNGLDKESIIEYLRYNFNL